MSATTEQKQWLLLPMEDGEPLGRIFKLKPKTLCDKYPTPYWVRGHMVVVVSCRLIGERRFVTIHSLTTTVAPDAQPGCLLPICPNPDTTPLNNHIQLILRNWTGSDVWASGYGVKKNCYVRSDNYAEIPWDWLSDTCGNDGATMQLNEHSWYLLKNFTATAEERDQNEVKIASSLG